MKKLISLASLIGGILLTPAVSFAGSWTEVPGAATGVKFNSISGLAAVNGGDVWAVGHSGASSSTGKTLTEHWDGASWTLVPSPNVSPEINYLYAVSARTSKDVWAVGQTSEDSGVTLRPLVEHWNGRKWSVIPSPTVGQYDQLRGVYALARNDAWAVGDSLTLTSGSTYILMHWDGTAWSLVSAPPASSSSLSSVKAFASNDVWAVGSKDFDYNANAASTFILHWDGTAWSEIPSPNVDVGNYLSGVDGAAPDDLWAVGESVSSPSAFTTLALHWDGTAWMVVPTPVINNQESLYAVKAINPRNVWAVGASSFAPLSEHWDGTQWTIVPTPPAEDNSGLLLAITASRDGPMWAAGQQGFGRYLDQLFLTMTR